MRASISVLFFFLLLHVASSFCRADAPEPGLLFYLSGDHEFHHAKFREIRVIIVHRSLPKSLKSGARKNDRFQPCPDRTDEIKEPPRSNMRFEFLANRVGSLALAIRSALTAVPPHVARPGKLPANLIFP